MKNIILKLNSLEKKLFSKFKYNMKNNISPLDEGIEQAPKAKRTRAPKHTFKLGDIKKQDVKETGFTTKQQAFKFLDALDKKYTDFKTKDELVDFIKSKKDKLNLDFSKFGKSWKSTKTNRQFKVNFKDIENKLDKYDARKPKKYHITAEINRGITFTSKKGKVTKYGSNALQTKDSLLDSRVIEAKSEKEAKDIMIAEIEEAFAMDEYSGAAKYNVDSINFIDSVNESSLTTQHTTQMPMKYAEHVDYSFTNEDKQFLNINSEGTCVIDNFIGLYGAELKLTRDDFIKLHQDFYNINDFWKKGIAPAFLEYICKLYDISHYAYDINNECFMKFISQNRNHISLIYYAINNHMYLVKEENKKSLVERAKEEHNINTSLLEGHEKINPFDALPIVENLDFNNVEKYDNINCVFMFSRSTHNINDIFYLFLSKYNIIPNVDKTHKTNIMQFTHKIDNIIHIYAADPNEIHVITYKEVKYLCNKNEIEWKNQTFMEYVKQMKNKFFNAKNGRTQFTTNQRHAILKRFNFKCNKCQCDITDNKFDIDHIIPLANGGTNKADNLQPLCKPCHGDKCSDEHESGEYIKIIDSESSFNNHIQTVIDSQLAQTHAFIETIENPKSESSLDSGIEPTNEPKIFNIDINKCRKNILYYGVDDYCVFTVFDKVKKYKHRNNLLKGLYYVESDNYLPLRGNGFYYHNMIKYCLDNDIITHDNIKYEVISSLTIPSNYYNEFIEDCYKNIDNYDVICEKLNIMNDDIIDYKKLAINGLIGNFKPNHNKRANWSSLCITNNSNEAFTNYIKNDGAFIHSFKVDDKRYYHALKQGYKTNLENEIPIYNQILQQEQIELHKLMMIVKNNNGTVLDVNTDAVSCIFEGDELPFELDGINLNGFYYDDKKLIPKYKIEDKGRLKCARMSNNIRTDKYIHDIKYNWNVVPDVEDNNFEPLVKKILDSNESYFITGAGGSGKSTLINMLKQRIREFEETDDEEEEEVKTVKDTTAIIKIKNNIAAKKEKLEKAIVKINTKIQAKESKLEDGAKRLLTKLSCNKKLETQQRINKNGHELEKLKKELEKVNKDFNDELIELNKQLEEQKITEVEVDNIKSYVSLAPTNLAALIIDGMTIHKFCCTCKSYDILKAMKFKYIFVDEVSMLQEKFYKFLIMLQKLKPETKFIISGDYDQLPAICDRISENYNYARNPAIFELCNFNKVQLTKCRRANDKLFNLIKSDNVPNLTPSNFNTTSKITNYNVHLCFTNKKRIRINDALMEAKKIFYKGSSIKLNKLFWDENSRM